MYLIIEVKTLLHRGNGCQHDSPIQICYSGLEYADHVEHQRRYATFFTRPEDNDFATDICAQISGQHASQHSIIRSFDATSLFDHPGKSGGAILRCRVDSQNLRTKAALIHGNECKSLNSGCNSNHPWR